MVQKIILCITIVGVSLLSVLTLFHTGLHPTHDGEYHVIRFYEFYQVLQSGVFYPRIAPDLHFGYGVPLFNFVYPLPNYAAGFLHMIGLSFIDSFKVSMIIASIIGAFGMFLWSNRYWGKMGAMISVVVYSFAPYRLLDIFIRGSVGEIWALAIMPFLMWATDKLIIENDKRFIPITGLLLGLLVFSHNILALLFVIFFTTYGGYVLVQKKSKKNIVSYLIAILLGIGLSAIFWLPAIVEKQFVRGLEIFAVERHFVELYQLIIPSWGSGFSGETSGSSLSFQIGIINLLIICLSLLYLFRKRIYKSVVVFCLVWICLSVFLMLPFSKSIWDTVPLLNFFQFPWRLLSLVIILSAFLAGILPSFKFGKVLSVVVASLAIFFSYSYTIPAYFHERSDEYYISKSNFIHGTNSPGDVFNTIWIEQKKNTPEAKIIGNDGVELSNIIIRPELYSFEYLSTNDTTLQVKSAYFPGWEARFNRQRVKLQKAKDGTMEISLPKGNYNVNIVFADTIIRALAISVSLVSLIIVIALSVKLTLYENRNR